MIKGYINSCSGNPMTIFIGYIFSIVNEPTWGIFTISTTSPLTENKFRINMK